MNERAVSVGTGLNLEFTGERIVPGRVPESTFWEHEARYLFAGNFVTGKDVLDVACGTGIGTAYLRKVGARTCIGLDIDKAAVDYATATYRNCSFAEGEATRLALGDNSIDVVVSFETIEHVKDQPRFLAECERVLRPGGLLICSTPNRFVSRWWEDNPFHVRELHISEFEQLVNALFVDVQLHMQSAIFYWIHVVRLLVLRGLDKLELKNALKTMMGRQGPRASKSIEFGQEGIHKAYEVRPYRQNMMFKPCYVIAVGRKAG